MNTTIYKLYLTKYTTPTFISVEEVFCGIFLKKLKGINSLSFSNFRTYMLSTKELPTSFKNPR